MPFWSISVLIWENLNGAFPFGSKLPVQNYLMQNHSSVDSEFLGELNASFL